MMVEPAEIVFLLDVDNTLLDNDGFQHDLTAHLTQELGLAGCQRYWAILDSLRHQHGYVDYLGAVQCLRVERCDEARMLLLASFILDYPFASRLYAGVRESLRHLQQFGLTVILSDGDAVLQPRKIQRSGLWEAVDGRVLIYIHKENMLELVAEQYPARRYVMIDDKLQILAAMKLHWLDRLATVWLRQGHYAVDPVQVLSQPAADLALDHIGALLDYDFSMASFARAGDHTAQPNTLTGAPR